MTHHIGYSTFGYGGMIFGALLFLAFIVGLIVLIVWAVKSASKGNKVDTISTLQSPQEVAKMRYAKGELTREEYQALLDDLK